MANLKDYQSTSPLSGFTNSDATLGIAGPNAAAPSIPTAPSVLDVEQRVREAAGQEGLNPSHMANLARAESNFNVFADAHKTDPNSHAYGVMQLQPDLAKSLGVDSTNWKENVYGGMQHFKNLLTHYGGDYEKATLAYHDGQGKIDKNTPSPEALAYKEKIMGKSAPGNKPANIQDYLPEDPTTSLPLTQQTPPSSSMFSGPYWDMLGKAGQAVKPYMPEIAAGAVGLIPGMQPEALAMYPVLKAWQQAGAVKAGKLTPEQGVANIGQAAKQNVAAGLGGEVLEKVGGPVANYVYKKLAGVGQGASEAGARQIITDMTERNIPAVMGREAKVAKLKGVQNDIQDEIFNKYTPQTTPGQQVPGLVKTGAAGAASAQQGASLVSPGIVTNAAKRSEIFQDTVQHYITERTTPITEIESALGKRGYGLVKALRDGDMETAKRLMPSVYEDTKGAFGNFTGGMPENISFSEARILKQNMAKGIPVGQEMEGMQAARDTVRHFTNQNIAKNIPDAVDKSRFLASGEELKKLINIEEFPRFGRPIAKALMGGQVAMPVAAALGGASTGYYQHHDPGAAIQRGLMFGALTGAAMPSALVQMLRSPVASQIGQAALRARGQTDIPQQRPYSPEEAQAMRDYFQKNFGAPQF